MQRLAEMASSDHSIRFIERILKHIRNLKSAPATIRVEFSINKSPNVVIWDILDISLILVSMTQNTDDSWQAVMMASTVIPG